MRARRLTGTVTSGLLLLGAASWAVGADSLAARHAPGRAVYEKWCAPCHDPGIIHPGTHALMTKYPNSTRASGLITAWTDLPATYVTFMVRHGISVMPAFRKTEISDAELAALAAYLARNTPTGR
ncbi:MAG TPA: cytochrome c [Steroidobacteraceae bacterium]|jgi:mono/diheme cytochrome c family protein|nr:cytochrome c [Steroidobacteraceae bacterium]